MEYYRVPPMIINTIKEMMKKWKIQLTMNKEIIGDIQIKQEYYKEIHYYLY